MTLELQNMITEYTENNCKKLVRASRREPWHTNDLNKLKLKAKKLHKAYVTDKNNLQLKLEYKVMKNKFYKLVKERKQDYYENKIKSSDTRKMWQNLKEATYTTKCLKFQLKSLE